MRGRKPAFLALLLALSQWSLQAELQQWVQTLPSLMAPPGTRVARAFSCSFWLAHPCPCMGALNPSHIFHKEFVHPSPEGDGNDGDGNSVGGGRFECCGYAGCGMDVVMNLLYRVPWPPTRMLTTQSSLARLHLKTQPDFPVDSYTASNPFLSLSFFIWLQ